jgi:TMEM175 potassium channel family protein
VWIIDRMTKTRIEAFSDGVFAIAITLLVLNLHADQSVTRQWPSYAAFAFGFLTIGVMWVNHHHLMHQFGHVDRVLLFLNLLLLLGIVFIAFPTALIAEHIRDGDARTATLAYGCTGVFLAIFFNALWHYGAHGRRLLRADTREREISGITRSYLPGVPLYLTGALLSFASPVASASVYAAIAVFYAISNTFFGKEPAG